MATRFHAPMTTEERKARLEPMLAELEHNVIDFVGTITSRTIPEMTRMAANKNWSSGNLITFAGLAGLVVIAGFCIFALEESTSG